MVCSQIRCEGIAEAGDADVGHGDEDRVRLGCILRQVVEGQHRFLVELAVQCLGGVVQCGRVDNAQMKFTGALVADLLALIRPEHAVDQGRSGHHRAG
ncbi:Uncharacterised protein [Mycobacterium tuberculosis]|nr:Uncharacterised protein [Mycobacterium tuberculosis]